MVVNNIGVQPGQGIDVPPKNKWVAFLLCLLLGYLGAHYFYVGKIGMGILYLLTLGLVGIGWIVDIVREGQCAVFMKGGALADIMGPGTFTLTTENLPLLSTLAAFKHAFNSPVKADLYFINTRQFVDNAWGTRNPIMMRDPDLGMIRVRAFGRFAFRIEDVVQFSREVLAARKLFSTTDIVSYLASIIGESVATTLAKSGVSALDFAMGYREHGARVAEEASRTSSSFGIRFTNVVVENASLPDEVEQLIDEQSGIALARKDMASFLEYQNARALRDAAKQEGGLAGLGAGAALGGIMAERVSSASPPSAQKADEHADTAQIAQALRELKALVDEGILSQAEFEAKKKHLLGL